MKRNNSGRGVVAIAVAVFLGFAAKTIYQTPLLNFSIYGSITLLHVVVFGCLVCALIGLSDMFGGKGRKAGRYNPPYSQPYNPPVAEYRNEMRSNEMQIGGRRNRR